MRRTPLLGVIGASLCLLMAAANQATDAALPTPLRAHLQAERFGIVTSIRGLPLGVRDGLQTLFGSPTLDIVDPGADYQTRRLVAAGCSGDHHCLVYYQRRGNAPAWHVALFLWTPSATRFEWGGTAPAGLATIEDVRKAILSGAIKGPATTW